jgi:hypothetical protein
MPQQKCIRRVERECPYCHHRRAIETTTSYPTLTPDAGSGETWYECEQCHQETDGS